MQETSASESTNVMTVIVFKICDGVISCTGILIDFGDEDTRIGEIVIIDHRRGTVGNIRSIESERGEV